MRPFRYTVPCARPAETVTTDDFGNPVGENRAAAEFAAVFVPPLTQAGSRIIDGALREQTVTKPTLYVDARPDVRSGDPIIVDGVGGWQVDGDPVVWPGGHPWTGWNPPMIIELRKSVG